MHILNAKDTTDHRSLAGNTPLFQDRDKVSRPLGIHYRMKNGVRECEKSLSCLLWPDSEREWGPGVVEAEAVVSEVNCSRCHVEQYVVEG